MYQCTFRGKGIIRKRCLAHLRGDIRSLTLTVSSASRRNDEKVVAAGRRKSLTKVGHPLGTRIRVRMYWPPLAPALRSSAAFRNPRREKTNLPPLRGAAWKLQVLG